MTVTTCGKVSAAPMAALGASLKTKSCSCDTPIANAGPSWCSIGVISEICASGTVRRTPRLLELSAMMSVPAVCSTSVRGSHTPFEVRRRIWRAKAVLGP